MFNCGLFLRDHGAGVGSGEIGVSRVSGLLDVPK